jgi:hypothetical protein
MVCFRLPTASKFREILVPFPAEAKLCLFCKAPRPFSGPTFPTIPAVPRTLSSRVKWPEREADNSPPSAEVMDLCGYNSTLPYSFATCTWITHPSPSHCTNVYNTSNFTLFSHIRLDGGTVSRYSINFPATFPSYSQRLRFIFIESNCGLERGCFKRLIMQSPMANLRHLCAQAVCLLPTVTYLLTPWKFTYSVEQSPWEANRFSVSQIPRILWNPKVHYCSQKCPSTVPIRSQLHSVHNPTSHFLSTGRDEYGPY